MLYIQGHLDDLFRYAEQDEEDRELAMLALGHSKSVEARKESDKKVRLIDRGEAFITAVGRRGETEA